MSALSDVKSVILTLVSEEPTPPGMCRQWTRSHAELVRSERLAPWLFRSLADREDCGLDSQIAAEFQHQYRFSSLACLRREMALRELLEVFNHQGIPLVFLKGIYLGNCVYKDAASRPMVDVDVLVREKDLHAAELHLCQLGYQRLVDPSPVEHEVLLAPRPYGRSGPNPVMIDVHHGIRLIDYYRFPAEVLWSNRLEEELFGYKVFYLSPELNFIHLTLHNLNHGSSIRDWLDLLLMLRTIDLDWDLLMPLARDLAAIRPLFWGFQELRREWGVALPPHVSHSLDTYAPHWLEDKMIRHRFRYFWRRVARMTLFDGWSDRAHYVLNKLIPRISGPFSPSLALSWIARMSSRASFFLHSGSQR